MITGAHAILYSRDADADRAFLRDVLGLRGVDAGGGWLILALPPAEVAVHPTEEACRHELYLMCEDVEALVRTLKRKRVRCSPVSDQRWGLLTTVTLPGGGELGIYEPRHRRAGEARSRARSRSRSRSGSGSARRGRGQG